jgi:hypothetical protein
MAKAWSEAPESEAQEPEAQEPEPSRETDEPPAAEIIAASDN